MGSETVKKQNNELTIKNDIKYILPSWKPKNILINYIASSSLATCMHIKIDGSIIFLNTFIHTYFGGSYRNSRQCTTKALKTFIDVHSIRVFDADYAITAKDILYAQFIEVFCKWLSITRTWILYFLLFSLKHSINCFSFHNNSRKLQRRFKRSTYKNEHFSISFSVLLENKVWMKRCIRYQIFFISLVVDSPSLCDMVKTMRTNEQTLLIAFWCIQTFFNSFFCSFNFNKWYHKLPTSTIMW